MKPGGAKLGRPPKFVEPRRPVTVTLPDRTLQQLAALDKDRARAIVKAVDHATAQDGSAAGAVEARPVAPGAAVILVPACHNLQAIPWLRMVEVAPGRCLMAVETGKTIEQLEVAIRDGLEDLPPSETYEREVLSAVLKVLSGSRRQKRVTKAEILMVDTRQRP